MLQPPLDEIRTCARAHTHTQIHTYMPHTYINTCSQIQLDTEEDEEGVGAQVKSAEWGNAQNHDPIWIEARKQTNVIRQQESRVNPQPSTLRSATRRVE
jgi:hypothetical protein